MLLQVIFYVGKYVREIKGKSLSTRLIVLRFQTGQFPILSSGRWSQEHIMGTNQNVEYTFLRYFSVSINDVYAIPHLGVLVISAGRNKKHSN